MGCVTQIGEQGWNIGRMVPMVAGWPETVCGTTRRPPVRLLDADELQRGRRRLVGPARRRRLGRRRDDVARPDGLERRRPLGQAARPLADRAAGHLGRGDREGVGARPRGSSTRTRSSRTAARSPRSTRAASRTRSSRSRSAAAGAAVLVGVDEAPRRDTSAERLASLQPAFIPDGVVTAGNSSQIVDGAAAVLVTSESAASRLGLEPRARFVSFGLSGVDPHRMLHGNPEACRKALARAGLTWDDIAVIEVNEAFACVVLQFAQDAGLEDRFDDINPNGGGISLGHPLGATGARVTATLAERARPARGALRRRLHVHRLRPGDRGRGRAPVAQTGCAQLEPQVRADLGGELEERARGRRAVAVAVPGERDPALRDRGLDLEHAARDRRSRRPRGGDDRGAEARRDEPLHGAVVVEPEVRSRPRRPRTASSLSASDVVRQARFPIRLSPPSSGSRVRPADASSLSAGTARTYGSRRSSCHSKGPSSVGTIVNASSSSPRSTSRSRSSSDVDSRSSRSTRGHSRRKRLMISGSTFAPTLWKVPIRSEPSCPWTSAFRSACAACSRATIASA